MPISGKKVIKLLLKDGWTKVSQSGSHVKLTKGSLVTIIPLHGNRDLPKGTLRSIEKQTGVKLK
jgi:predicted RNA binding protein YcfA (HicA-like mRNA interferase family)